jgi:acyl-CoA reductase-like NAD-dependent aldehyde dehydrogenase
VMPLAETGKNQEEPRESSRRQTMIESQIEAKNFIGGEWVPADSGEVYEVTNPANPSEVLGTTPKSGKAEAERAIEAAAKAAPGWKATLPAERGAILSKAADLLESQTDELAELMAREVGKPMVESRAEVARAAAIFRYYGSEGWRLDGIMPPSTRPGIHISSAREPLGVVALITPWNFPLAIPAWKMAPALICGNTIVIKPATDASLDAAALMRVLAEAGLPDGFVKLVTGSGSTVGDALVTDPRV